MLRYFLKGRGTISKVESINQVCSHHELFTSLVNSLPGCVDDCLASTANTNPKLMWRKEFCSFACYRCSCTLGGKTAQNITHSNRSQASITFLACM